MFVIFRPGRNRPNIGGPNVRGFSAWPKWPEHWGQIGRNRPNIGVRLFVGGLGRMEIFYFPNIVGFFGRVGFF